MPNYLTTIPKRKELTKDKKERNLYISYIKGVAIIGITLIHLIDWSNMRLPLAGRIFEDLLHICVFLFVMTTGSVLLIAYEHRTTLDQVKRLFTRGFQILFIYYFYSLVKLLVFDFSTEPWYDQYISKGSLTVSDIIFLRSSSVPLAILVTFAFFLFLSPLILIIHKKTKYKKYSIALLAFTIFIINYFTPIPSINNTAINFLYAKNNIMFSIALWLVPLLIGFFLAQTGFEKQKFKIFLTSGLLTIVSIFYISLSHKSLWLADNEIPLSPFYIFASVFALSAFLCLFRFLEAYRNRYIKGFLATLRFLGDNTLHIFVFQWILIDLTRWIFPSLTGLIWLTVLLSVCFYLLLQKKKLLSYYHHQKEATKDLGMEVL